MVWELVSSDRVMGRGEQASGGMEVVVEEGIVTPPMGYGFYSNFSLYLFMKCRRACPPQASRMSTVLDSGDGATADLSDSKVTPDAFICKSEEFSFKPGRGTMKGRFIVWIQRYELGLNKK